MVQVRTNYLYYCMTFITMQSTTKLSQENPKSLKWAGCKESAKKWRSCLTYPFIVLVNAAYKNDN